jgi:hypothetical protein
LRERLFWGVVVVVFGFAERFGRLVIARAFYRFDTMAAKRAASGCFLRVGRFVAIESGFFFLGGRVGAGFEFPSLPQSSLLRSCICMEFMGPKTGVQHHVSWDDKLVVKSICMRGGRKDEAFHVEHDGLAG